jgi:hypothetical protein
MRVCARAPFFWHSIVQDLITKTSFTDTATKRANVKDWLSRLPNFIPVQDTRDCTLNSTKQNAFSSRRYDLQ